MTNSDNKKGAPATATPSNSDTGQCTKCSCAGQQDADLKLWTDVLALMASTYELASKLEGLNLPPEKIMDLARGFADEFMRRRAALIGGAK